MKAHPPRRSAAPPQRPGTRPPVDTAQPPRDNVFRHFLIVDGFSGDFVKEAADGDGTPVEMKRYSDADCHKVRELLQAYGVGWLAKHGHDPAAPDRINTAIRLLMVTADKVQRGWIGERIRSA